MSTSNRFAISSELKKVDPVTFPPIRVKSVRSHPEGSDVGYIGVTQFNERTTDALKQAINDLNTQLGADKIKGYILDLRNRCRRSFRSAAAMARCG